MYLQYGITGIRGEVEDGIPLAFNYGLDLYENSLYLEENERLVHTLIGIMQFCDDYQIETCNPCGEQPLPKHGACNLGSLNLSKFVKYPFEKAAYFDFKDFRRAVKIAVEALDTVVDENVKNHPLKEQAEMAKNYRNIGLGIMGLHDMLIKMGYTYGSGHSLNIIHDIMYTMFDEAVKTSANLAAKKGTFPAYNENVLRSEILISQVGEETL